MAIPQYAAEAGAQKDMTPAMTLRIQHANSYMRNIIGSLERLNEKVSGPSIKEIESNSLNKSAHEPCLMDQLDTLAAQIQRAQSIIDVLIQTI